MAKSVGIDPGDFAVKAVELDGSYGRTRLVRCHVERIVAEATDAVARAAASAEAVAACLQQGRMSGDMVLGHPCREAVLRTIEVPFRGADAIRRVIKSEVESAIHSHAVDDMVVDFHEIGGATEGARVLVAAVPKQGLRSMLQALEVEGIEPEHVDLDTMALYRVADWCGALVPEAAVAAGDAALPVVAAPAAGLTVVLDLGARSTRALLVEGGRLLDMRALRLGDSAVAESLARMHSLPLAAAREAVTSCLDGEEFCIDVDEAEATPAVAEADAAPAVVGGEAEAPPVPAAMRQVTVPIGDVQAEQATFLQRLSRELVRFLTSSGRASGAVQALWITGGASRMAGMAAMLQEVFGVAPRSLDVLSAMKHSLSADEAEAMGPHLAVAIGLALGNLGGPTGFDFRREDLGYTRGFDRIKFPLAIACMLALFAAIVFGVKTNNELKNLQYRLGLTYEGKDAKPKDPQFYGQLNAVVKSNQLDERYFKFLEGSRQYTRKELMQDIVRMDVADRIKFVRDKLRRALDLKQKESGIYEEVSLESGLAVLVRFFDVLQRAEANLGKYLLCTLELNMRASASGEHSGRFLTCRFAFRGDDFRERFAALRQAVEEECKREGSPFQAIDTRSGGDILFKNSADKGVTGAYYDLKIHIQGSFPPFTIGP